MLRFRSEHLRLCLRDRTVHGGWGADLSRGDLTRQVAMRTGCRVARYRKVSRGQLFAAMCAV